MAQDDNQPAPFELQGNIAGALMLTLQEHEVMGVIVGIGRGTVPMDKWIMVGFGTSDGARHDALGFIARFVAANLP